MKKRLLTMLALSACAAFGYENDGPGYDPSVPRPQTAKAVSTFAPPEESDVRIVVTKGGNLGQEVWTGGSISIPFEIKRYFGDKDKLIKNGGLPKTVTMTMIIYDVDSRSTYTPAEYDEVWVNGKKLSQALDGLDGTWTKQTFTFPTEYLKLPTKAGGRAANEVLVKVATKGGNWVTSVDWISIDIPAAPPVVLSHGIRSDKDSMEEIQSGLEALGLPVHTFDYSNHGNDGISSGAVQLLLAVHDAKEKFQVENVNVVAHSMGGLKAREYVEQYAGNLKEKCSDVKRIVQIATPNGGSPLADLAIMLRSSAEMVCDADQERCRKVVSDWGWLYSIATFFGKIDLWDRALDDLTTEHMASYNGLHGLRSDVHYSIFAGSVQDRPRRLEDAKEIMDYVYWLIYGVSGDNDEVVPVSSARCISMDEMVTLPGGTKFCSHSGLVEDGAPVVLQLCKSGLLERIQPDGNGSMCYARSERKLHDSEIRQFSPCFNGGFLPFGEKSFVRFGIEKGGDSSVLLSLANSANASVSLVSPSGRTYNGNSGGISFEWQDNSVLIKMTAPEVGEWRLCIEAHALKDANMNGCYYSYLMQEEGATASVEAELESASVRVGQTFTLFAKPSVGGRSASGNVKVIVTTADQKPQEIALHDDGVAPDQRKGDGVYSASISADVSGRYQMMVVAEMSAPQAFTRTCLITGTAFVSESAFSGNVAAHGEDSDSSGLYDRFNFSFGAQIAEAGQYRVLASLSDSDGRHICDGWSGNVSCPAGANDIIVSFRGAEIFAHGACDGYVVSEVKLIEVTDTYEAVVDERKDIFSTTAYNYRQFEHPLIAFGGGGSDSAADVDGDGIYDRLTVNLQLSSEAQVAGSYDWSASLQDGEGTTLGFVAGSVVLPSAGGTTMVTMTFEGSDILKTDLNGPFHLRNFILWNSVKTFTLADEYATKAYRLRDWGGVARHLSSFDFLDTELSVDEGRTLKVEIAPGDHTGYCSMQVFLTHGTTNAKDLALPKGRAFPFTVSWEAGDLTAKTIEIPIAADKAVEGAEEFYLQLANAEGMEIGENKLCTVTVRDMTVAASLAQALNSTDAKASSKGQGKWFAAPGCEYHFADVNRGVNHVESPALAQGQSSTLTLSAGKGPGKFVVLFRFTGNERESVSSTLEIYAGKEYLRNYVHTSVGNGWQEYTITDPNKGSHKYSYVFTQGSDPDAHVEFVGAYWVSQGEGNPIMVYASADDAGKGRVTGCGRYRYGATAKLTAKPNPGRTFFAWYRWSKANKKYEEYSKSANLTFKVVEEMDLMAVFTDLPIVRILSNPPDGGTVTGAGRYAAGKKVTLKAKANRGCVFRGWYDVAGALLSQDAKYTFTMPEGDVALTAAFVTAAEDLKAISLTVAGVAADAAQPLIASNVCGVAVSWPLAPAGLSATTVKAAGLPAGVKLVQDKKAKTWSISGVPTKPGPYTARLTVTTAAKNSQVFLINGIVTVLPGAAVGTFYGLVSAYDESIQQFYRSSSVASAVLTTTDVGGITLKLTTGFGAVSLTQKGWTEILGQYCHAELTSKKGETVDLYVDTQPSDWTGSGHVFGFVSGGRFGATSYYLEMQRSAFVKSKAGIEHLEAFMLADSLAGTYWFNVADKGNGTYEIVPAADKSAQFSVNVKSSGAVQVSGKIAGMKVSAATVLRPHPSDSSADVFCCAFVGKTTHVSIILSITPQGISGAIYF